MNKTIRQLLPFNSLAIATLVSLGALVGTTIEAGAEPSLTAQTRITSSDEALLAQTTSVGNLVEVADGNDNYDTFTQAVQTAGLEDTLANEGPYTVFAPTDEAFNNLPAGALDALLEPENRDLLTDILTYHVAPGDVTSDELQTGGLDTLNGGLAVRVNPDRVIVNNASVVEPDIDASNGTLHGINRVLIPPATLTELQARLGQSSDDEPVRALW